MIIHLSHFEQYLYMHLSVLAQLQIGLNFCLHKSRFKNVSGRIGIFTCTMFLYYKSLAAFHTPINQLRDRESNKYIKHH